ncbi:MAG: hypothetical protein LAN37_08230 [Acidobacteriia bacterium]|nr:hypothetical protein [Terriglobia bacterium]
MGAISMNQAEIQQQLPNHKLKTKKPGQRACNEKDEKGKLCGGHLKRWFYMADVKEQQCGDVATALGSNGEIYRCEFCKTLYLPNADDPRGLNVAGQGQVSVFGLTLPPKAEGEKPAAPAAAAKDQAAKDAAPKG